MRAEARTRVHVTAVGITQANVQGELDSFLIEISAIILAKKDEDGKSFIVDKILDKTGMKGTGARPAPPLCER